LPALLSCQLNILVIENRGKKNINQRGPKGQALPTRKNPADLTRKVESGNFKLMRKIFILPVFLLVFSFLFSSLASAGNDLPIREMSCIYPVKIFGSSMEPRFKEGERVSFNKCIDEIRSDLAPDTPVLFQRPNTRGISVSIIREKIVRPEGVFYQVSRVDHPENREEIAVTQLVGAYQDEAEMAALTEEEQRALAQFRGNPLIALGGFLTSLIFWGSIIFWKKKTGVAWRYFWAAVMVWSFMLGVKALMDFKLGPSSLFPKLSVTSLIGSVTIFLYYGLRTGLTENGFSFLYIKKKLKEASFNDAVAFGIAFNGVEALMVGLWTFGAALALFLKPDLLNFFPVHLRQEVIQAFGGSALYIPAQWIERSAVLFGGIFSSLLVFMTVRTRKLKYILIAVIYKMIVDGGLAVYLMHYPIAPAEGFVLWSYLIEIPIVIYGVVGILGALWLKKIYPKSLALLDKN